MQEAAQSRPSPPIPLLRRFGSALRVRARKRRSPDPHLPDFLIVGAQKCATSSLHVELNRHPHLYVARSMEGANEVHFFDQNWERGADWYRAHFPHADRLQGEKTPEYSAVPCCHSRMHSLLPHARLIFSMRDPVDRAYSNWNHFNQIREQSATWGWEVTPFETALAKQPLLLRRGQYIEQIESLLALFPRKQLHLMVAEHLRADPEREMARLYDFLGVARLPAQRIAVHRRSYESPMREETARRLAEHFRPYNERLFRLLGGRIAEWR